MESNELVQAQESAAVEAKITIDMSNDFITFVREYEITDNDTAVLAATMRKEVVQAIKTRTDSRMAITRIFDKGKAEVMSLFKPGIDMLEEAKKTWTDKIRSWDDRQETIRKEQERLAREAHEKEQQEMREAAEKARQEAEESKSQEDKERLEAQAEALDDTATTMTAPILAPQKTAGMSYRDNWKGDVDDMSLLLKAIVEGKAPITLVQPDSKAINQIAKATKGKQDIPGVRFFNEKIPVSR